MAGQTAHRFKISGISNANPCVVTTDTNDFETGNFVRITDLNGRIPTPRGCDQINNKKFLIVVVDTTHFKLKDKTTHEYINSTNFTPYVTGGNVNLVEFDFEYSA